jgi:hypothetical protein
MHPNIVVRVASSFSLLALAIVPAEADVKVLYRSGSHVVSHDASKAPGETATSPTAPVTDPVSALTVPAPLPASLAVAAGGTWNVVVTPTGGTKPYVFDVVGAPAVIQQVQDTATLTLSGIAPSATYAGIKVGVTDATGKRVESAAFTVVVADPVPVAAAHKYWRILVTGNRNKEDAYNGYTGLREIQLLDSAGADATDVANSGTPFASSIFSNSYPLKDAFDNNPASEWFSIAGSPVSVSTPQFIGYQFTNPVDVKNVTLNATDDAASIPRDFAVQWSDDGITYTTSATYNAIDLTNNVPQSFASVRAPVVKNADQHHYWRIAITKTFSNRTSYIHEMTFFSGATQHPVSSTGLVLGNRTNSVGGAFDGNPTTDAAGSGIPSTSNPSYYGYGFATPVAVSEIGVMSYAGAGGYDPVDFRIEWSDDGSNWSTSATHTAIPSWTKNVAKKYSTTVGSTGLVF